MTEETRPGFVLRDVATRAAHDDQADVDFAVQSALLQFDKGRFAERLVDDDRLADDDSLNFNFDTGNDGLF